MSDSGTQTEEVRFEVPEMDCPSCAGTVESAVGDVAGVEGVETLPTTGTAVVTVEGVESVEAVVEAIEGAGYEVVGSTADASEDGSGTGTEAAGPDDQGSVWQSERARKTWVSGLFAAGGLAVEFLVTGVNVELAGVFGRELLVADVLFLVAVATAGTTILRNGYYSLQQRNLDMDLLMSVAIVAAVGASAGFGAGLYLEAALLAVLFSVAELLERYSIDMARDSLRELMELSPDEATVRRDGEERAIPVEDVEIGDVVVVRPGEKIPMDGVVVDGESAVNQAPITGESVPVDKVVDDEVYAGTINESGYLEIEVRREAADNTVARIVELVEDAQANRTEREKFVDQFASYYTPVVVVFAVLTAAVPPLVIDGSWTVGVAGLAYTFPGAPGTWFLYGLTLLVIACPCAFVISTPVSVVSGITSAAKNGVLIKGGNHLESMGEIEAIALDKTGTLTTGELAVTDVVPLNDRTEADVLRSASGLEARSEHPIGEAIVEHASERDLDRPAVDSFESITGKGVEADLAGTPHYAGKPALFFDLGFDLDHVHAATDGGVVTTKSQRMCERNDCLDLLEDTIPRLQAEGKTIVLVGTEDELEGVIAVTDGIRPEARAAVERLHDLGVAEVVMLTGDNERTARAIAEQVGIDDYRAELLPEEKVDAIERLDDEFDGVAMVGDGVNDAPALAVATVGVAMGAAGTDTALETADIALMSDDLSGLPYLYELSRVGNGVIRQNVWASLAVKALLAVGVPFGLVPVWAAVLVGDAGMTVAITGNAMRLSRIVPTDLLGGDGAASTE